jgi:hypothetical protein
MSIPIVLHWLPNNPVGIAPLQDVTDGSNFILNCNIPSLSQGPYIFAQDTVPQQVVRQVTLTSANDYSGTTFTITGIGSPTENGDGTGNPTQVFSLISEDLVGPNNDTVSSINIYSQIISVSPDTDVAAVSIGYGANGITDYVFLDYNRTIFQTSVQLQFIHHDSATVTAYQTLSKPQYPSTVGNLINFQPLPYFLVPDIDAATVNSLGVLVSPVALTWATITGANTDELYFTVLQQGLRS